MKKILTVLALIFYISLNAQCSFTLNASVSLPTICAGGATTLTATGAVTYTWAPGGTLSNTTGANTVANPLTSTIYTVTGADMGGCTETATVSVAVNPMPAITVSQSTLINCSGYYGHDTLHVNGASTYTWSPSAGLNTTVDSLVISHANSTTTYTVLGTSSLGCFSAPAFITDSVIPTPTITVLPSSATICAGNTLTLTATGIASYNWLVLDQSYNPLVPVNTASNPISFTPTSTVTYTVGGQDANGCYASDIIGSVNVINTMPTLTITPYPSLTICSGDSIDLIASGAATYNWHTNNSSLTSISQYMPDWPAQTTTYYVTGTDVNGCVNSDSATVIVSSSPNISFSITQESTPHVWDVIPSISGNVSSFTYLWSWGDGDTTYGYTPYTNHTYTAAAHYNVCFIASDTNSGCYAIYCENDSLYRVNGANTVIQLNVVNATSGISEVAKQKKQISVYPNPALSTIQIAGINNQDEIKVFDVLGNEVLQSNQNTIDVSSLSNGVYFVQIGPNTQKFIVQH